MPFYARLLLIILGIGIVALNVWYLRKGYRARRMEESFGFDTAPDNYAKSEKSDDHRFQLWVLTFCNAIGIFLASIIILSFISNDVAVIMHYFETHNKPPASPSTPSP